MKFQLFILFFLLFLCNACRQEIIPPDNPAGNINEFNFTRTSSSYIFSINANQVTTVVTDNTYLNTINSRINSVIADYSSGSVEIKLLSGNIVLYSAVFDDNTTGSFKDIDGYLPEIIVFNFNNFTGKLKVSLTNVQ